MSLFIYHFFLLRSSSLRSSSLLHCHRVLALVIVTGYVCKPTFPRSQRVTCSLPHCSLYLYRSPTHDTSRLSRPAPLDHLHVSHCPLVAPDTSYSLHNSVFCPIVSAFVFLFMPPFLSASSRLSLPTTCGDDVTPRAIQTIASVLCNHNTIWMDYTRGRRIGNM